VIAVVGWILVGAFVAVGLLVGFGRPEALFPLPMAIVLAALLLVRRAFPSLWGLPIGLGMGVVAIVAPVVLRMVPCPAPGECYVPITITAAWFGLGLVLAGGLVGVLPKLRHRSA